MADNHEIAPLRALIVDQSFKEPLFTTDDGVAIHHARYIAHSNGLSAQELGALSPELAEQYKTAGQITFRHIGDIPQTMKREGQISWVTGLIDETVLFNPNDEEFVSNLSLSKRVEGVEARIHSDVVKDTLKVRFPDIYDPTRNDTVQHHAQFLLETFISNRDKNKQIEEAEDDQREIHTRLRDAQLYSLVKHFFLTTDGIQNLSHAVQDLVIHEAATTVDIQTLLSQVKLTIDKFKPSGTEGQIFAYKPYAHNLTTAEDSRPLLNLIQAAIPPEDHASDQLTQQTAQIATSMLYMFRRTAPSLYPEEERYPHTAFFYDYFFALATTQDIAYVTKAAPWMLRQIAGQQSRMRFLDELADLMGARYVEIDRFNDDIIDEWQYQRTLPKKRSLAFTEFLSHPDPSYLAMLVDAKNPGIGGPYTDRAEGIITLFNLLESQKLDVPLNKTNKLTFQMIYDGKLKEMLMKRDGIVTATSYQELLQYNEHLGIVSQQIRSHLLRSDPKTLVLDALANLLLDQAGWFKFRTDSYQLRNLEVPEDLSHSSYYRRFIQLLYANKNPEPGNEARILEGILQGMFLDSAPKTSRETTAILQTNRQRLLEIHRVHPWLVSYDDTFPRIYDDKEINPDLAEYNIDELRFSPSKGIGSGYKIEIKTTLPVTIDANEFFSLTLFMEPDGSIFKDDGTKLSVNTFIFAKLQQLLTDRIHFITHGELYGKKRSDFIANFDEIKRDPNRKRPYWADLVGSSRVDLQACKLEYSIVSPK